jgi:hypothetical protein
VTPEPPALRAAAEHLQAAEPLLSAAIREAAQVRSQWLMSAAELAVCYDRTRNRISQILRSMAVEPSLPGGGSRGPLYDFLVVGPLLEARGLRLVNPPPQAA